MAEVCSGIDFAKLDRLAAAGDRQLSSDERWRQILGMMQFAANVMYSSPESKRIQAFKESQEAEWRQVQKRLFADAARV